jgi:hypothetical protein
MKHFILIASIILLFSSCVSTNYLIVEFKEPARITLPPEVVNVVVVDNSYMSEEQPSHVVLPQKDTILVSADSARMHLGESMAKYMEEEKFFNAVTYYPNFRRGADSLQIYLTNDQIADICYKTNSDALICINQSIISGTMELIPFFYDYAVLSVGVAASIKAYKADGTALHDSYILADTLFWEGIPKEMKVSKKASADVPIIDIQQSMMESAEMAADVLTNLYIPFWSKEERHYYTGGSSEMKKAAAHANEYQWSEAALIWGKLYEQETKPVKQIRLAYNIALANECLNDIDNALIWNKTAFDLLSNTNNSELRQSVTQQGKLLRNRKNQLQKLALQYGSE